MTDIPLGARVECAGSTCGRATHVIINPTTQQVTHFVVREKGLLHTERLVPVDQVMQTKRDVVNLCCTRDELAAMKPFIVTQYVQVEFLRSKDYPSDYTYRHNWEWVPVKHEHIPRGGLAVRRGARVQAIDGRVGRVEEFLMDPASGHLTHLVMRRGHSWVPKDVTIPISEISRIGKRAVYLTLDRHSVESLPAVPVKWH
jgi:uncharacterized protein YrrD